MPRSDSGSSNKDHPTIPELVSSLRYAFATADFDRVEQALIRRETKLMRENQRLKETAELDDLAAVKTEAAVDDGEGRKVIASLKRESECLKRMVALEDDVMRTVRLMGEEDRGGIGGFENLESLLDYLIAAKADGTLKNSGKRSSLERAIEKQKEEYAKLEEELMFEKLKMLNAENEYASLLSKHQLQLKEKETVENELKDCQMEIQQLKEKHREDIADIENKYRLELLEVENELKVSKDALDKSEKKQKLLEEDHKNEYETLEQRCQSERLELLKVEKELKVCKDALEESNQKQRLLEEEHKNEFETLEQRSESERLKLLKVEKEHKVCKDALDESNQKQKLHEEQCKNEYEELEQRCQSQREEVEIELKNCKAELMELQEHKKISDEKYEKLVEKVNIHREDEEGVGNFDSQKKQVNNALKYVENETSRLNKVMSPNHVIDVDDLCDSMSPTTSHKKNVVGESGTSKSSFAEAILLSDSDDDYAPQDPKFSGLKRKRTSSQTTDCDLAKQRRLLGRCDSMGSEFGKKKSPSTSNQKMSKQMSLIESSAMLNIQSAASSSCMFSSDDSDNDNDTNNLILNQH